MADALSNVNVNPFEVEKQNKNLMDEKNPSKKKKFEYDATHYLNLRPNPGETTKKTKIRILPVSATEHTPFMEVHTHSMKVSTDVSRSGYKSFICLNEPRMKEIFPEGLLTGCPICEKSEEYLKASREETDEATRKSLFKRGMEIRSKRTFIVRVIERGHEDEGVKFWRFNEYKDGTGIYDQLYSIYKNRAEESIEAGDAYYRIVTNVDGEKANTHYEKVDEDTYNALPEDERTIIPYNVFDLNNGRDIIVTTVYNPSTKKVSTNIDSAGNNTPLSKDTEQALRWVYDEKTWSDLYSLKNYDYLSLIVEGKVPYFDKAENKWIPKEEFEAKYRRQEQAPNTEETSYDEQQQGGDDDADLPF